MKKLFLIISLAFLASCTNKVVEVKSPCVSLNDGPCGKKMPINSWWLNQEQA